MPDAPLPGGHVRLPTAALRGKVGLGPLLALATLVLAGCTSTPGGALHIRANGTERSITLERDPQALAGLGSGWLVRGYTAGSLTMVDAAK